MKRKIVEGLLIGVTVLIAVVLLLNVVVKQKIQEGIEQEFGKALVYENLDLNLFGGRLSLEGSVLTLENARIGSENIEVEGFSYRSYLSNDKIVVDRFSIVHPEIVFYKQKPDTSDTSEKFEDDILIRSFEISGGSIQLSEDKAAENQLFFGFEDLVLENVSINETTFQEKIPFSYDSYKVSGDSLYLDLDQEHVLSIGNVTGNNGDFLMEELMIIPKFSVEEFQRQIPYEKDRFELSVDSIEFDNLSWRFVNDSLLLQDPLLRIVGAKLEVYRNKLLPDDRSKKTLYSEKIRESPVKLKFAEVAIEESTIIYKEQIREDTGPAVVNFSNLKANISGITNVGMKEEDFPTTEIEASANLMGEALVEINWEFDVRNTMEEFSISGSLASLSNEGINSFLKPALGVETQGRIESLAFNFNGNDDTARGDMRLQYKDFKITVLRNDGTKKSGFLTAIANLFINTDALNEDINHEDLQVTRDKEKSFWNFLWKFIEAGALKSLL